ncbi:Xaa-Pro peptidase family protein [Labrenzia sp. R5_0]|jgi:Xaa-Pro aminopeptidase|uniref:M24 family metallopeptidase n=1 Tax=Stappiaceae TaxID=2821832 RepID=UPI001ADAA803|nr:Xaa-Pro peptidase family protein [Labrenzia sp. R5_0]MBO9458346.1 aminopeptidase P family protein [Labrenzia sp. R5_0]MEC9403880.1 Xaa-Pro peptidase family protein [Pseudomonadota bacterium]MEC9469134.1 Xaa-Pro peptidase family protein [Pseudomonadota bacterium]
MAELDWHAERSDLQGLAQLDRAPEVEGIDLVAVRTYRQQRVRQKMAEYGVDAVILSDPVNIRYATGTRNMQVFSMRNAPSRYLLLTQNRSILFEFTGCLHLGEGYETVDEVRPSKTASFVAAGPHIAERERAWAAEMADTIHELTGLKDATVGLERLNAGTAIALKEAGLNVVDAQQPVEMARAIKSPEEMKCVIASLRATEIGVGKLREAIRPGLTEAELWSVLHKSIIAQNGDYVETRLLNAGARTNPWFQETSDNVIGANELIALDTDVVGCHGYYADFSRTFHSGPDRPTDTQRELYKVAYEQVHYNMGILKPGMSFREYADRAWNIPDRYYANRYYLSAHGCGMTGEYPYLYHHGDFPDAGYDGVVEPGMTLCVESYIGEDGAKEGVKLEQQVLITETGIETLSRFPFEAHLLT